MAMRPNVMSTPLRRVNRLSDCPVSWNHVPEHCIYTVFRGVVLMVSDNSLVSADLSDQPRLLGRVRDRLRVKHYSLRTDIADRGWIRRHIHVSWQAPSRRDGQG